MTDGLWNGTPAPGAEESPTMSNAKEKARRACANCARLKMKCEWPQDQYDQAPSCIRCQRGGVSCQVPELARRKKRGKSTRVAQLERKIDNIALLLANANQGSAVHNAPSPLTPESHDHVRVHRPLQGEERYAGEPVSSLDYVPQGETRELLPGFTVTAEQAFEYIHDFRDDYTRKFPFVVLDPKFCPNMLFTQSPLLFWTIMGAIAPLTHDVQRAFKRWFRRSIAQEIIVEQKKRLDLLQALLVHLSWGNIISQFETNTTNYIQLAIGLVVDMKLDRPPGKTYEAPNAMLEDAVTDLHREFQRPASYHSRHEKRAALGVYHISYLVFILFKRGTYLPWTSYLGRCCDDLADSSEFQTDGLLVGLTRLNLASERSQHLMRGDDLADGLKLSHILVMDGVRDALSSVVNAQRDHVKTDSVLRVHWKSLLCRLYEPVLSRSPSPPTFDMARAEPSQQCDILWRCLQAAADLYEAFLTIPGSELNALSTSSTACLAFASITTPRLLLTEPLDGWDSALARKKFDFAEILKRLMERYEEGERWASTSRRKQADLNDGSAIFFKFSFKVRWMRQWYLTKTSQEQAETQGAPGAADACALPTDGVVPWQDMDLDVGFWQELMAITGSEPPHMAPRLDIQG